MQNLWHGESLHADMTERRIRYYIVHASADENQNGTYHHSKPYADLELAKRDAADVQDDFVVVEKHHELREPPPAGFVYRKPELEWEVDHDAGGIEVEDY